jgi:transposase
MDSDKRSAQLERLEVVDTGRRRRWSEDEKLKIVLESLRAPRQISATARRYGLLRSLLIKWREPFRPERCAPPGEQVGFVPAMVVAESVLPVPAVPARGGVEHHDEYLRASPRTGEPVDHHRHAVARVVDDSLSPAACDWRIVTATLPGVVEFAEARISVPTGRWRCNPPRGSTNVTCLRLSSRGTAAQSGSAKRRWPWRLPQPAPANSRASRTASVTSSGNGQLRPAASNRRIVNRTVEGAGPTAAQSRRSALRPPSS